MKEILFRGKRIDTDEWIVGYYINVVDFESREECPVILPMDVDLYSYGEIYDFDFVDPETVGQFVGCVDRYGEDIFEGDVLARGSIQVVVRDICRFAGLRLNCDEYEVIGNIYDNPELDG